MCEECDNERYEDDEDVDDEEYDPASEPLAGRVERGADFLDGRGTWGPVIDLATMVINEEESCVLAQLHWAETGEDYGWSGILAYFGINSEDSERLGFDCPGDGTVAQWQAAWVAVIRERQP